MRPRQKRGERPDNAAGFPVTLAPSLPLPGYEGLRFGLPANRLLRQNWTRQRPDAVYVATEGPLGWLAVHVTTGESGLRAPYADAFMNAAVRLAQDPTLRHRIRRQARVHAAALDWQSVVDRFATLLNGASPCLTEML